MKLKAAILSSLLSVSALAQAAAPGQISRELTAKYSVYVKSFTVDQMEPVQNLFASDWVGVKNGKRFNRAEMLDMTRLAMDATTLINDMCITLGKITRKGNQVTVLTNDSADLTVTDADGDEHHLLINGKSRHTWVREGGTLKLKRSEVLSRSVKVNGKLASPNYAPPIIL